MHLLLRNLFFLIPLLFPLFLSSCASLSQHPPEGELKTYSVSENKSLLSLFSPFFTIENAEDRFNLIGTPRTQITNDKDDKVFIDHTMPTIYSEIRNFKTVKDSYTNLIYRIHFEKVPFGLIPFYIGYGKNVGLTTIATLNSNNEPVLYTTIHTCGCYIAFVPTSYMPHDAFPDNWGTGRQSVFGENLPRHLDYNGMVLNDSKIMILIRGGSHRVKDMWLVDSDSFKTNDTVLADMKAMTSLEKLDLKNGTTSFYETSGSRKGYVKGSHKIWERLLMSWWVLDWRVGEDKKLGENRDDGPVFYTSLKPWARRKSDLRDFPSFLSYWGWGL